MPNEIKLIVGGLGLLLLTLVISSSVNKTKVDTLLNKASRLEDTVKRLEDQLHGTCEPSLQYEKRCTRIQYLYKNGYFRGVKCLRWED